MNANDIVSQFYTLSTEERLRAFDKIFSLLVNDMRFDPKATAEAVLNDHRTLLQKKMAFAYAMVREAANQNADGFTDGRNERSFHIAEEIARYLDANYPGWEFPPLI